MRKTQLALAVRNALPPDAPWPNNGDDVRFEGGKTVLMLVARVPDPQLAVKLLDFVCPHHANFWATDSWGRHVIMDACHHGVHPSVLLRLVKWARKCSLGVVEPMARRDVNGLDAVELAIRAGHGDLASCLLDHRHPASYYDSFCSHYPLEVLELAIESSDEQSALDVLANKRVVQDLQSGRVARLNVAMRWMQRQNARKRLFNVFTCVRAAVRCNLPRIVRTILKINPEETRQAAWYAVCTLRSEPSSSSFTTNVAPEIKRVANSYRLDKVWPQIGVIVLLQHWELLARNEHGGALWQRVRHPWHHRDWDAIASNSWTALPSELFSRIVSFLVPSEALEMEKMAILVEY